MKLFKKILVSFFVFILIGVSCFSLFACNDAEIVGKWMQYSIEIDGSVKYAGDKDCPITYYDFKEDGTYLVLDEYENVTEDGVWSKARGKYQIGFSGSVMSFTLNKNELTTSHNIGDEEERIVKIVLKKCK